MRELYHLTICNGIIYKRYGIKVYNSEKEEWRVRFKSRTQMKQMEKIKSATKWKLSTLWRGNRINCSNHVISRKIADCFLIKYFVLNMYFLVVLVRYIFLLSFCLYDDWVNEQRSQVKTQVSISESWILRPGKICSSIYLLTYTCT